MADTPQIPLTVRIGDTETITVTCKTDGVPINITGRTYAAQIRSTAASTAIVATFNCTIANGTAGVFACTLGTAVTSALTAGQAVFDIQETNGSTVTTLLAGPVFIVQDVTR